MIYKVWWPEELKLSLFCSSQKNHLARKEDRSAIFNHLRYWFQNTKLVSSYTSYAVPAWILTNIGIWTCQLSFDEPVDFFKLNSKLPMYYIMLNFGFFKEKNSLTFIDIFLSLLFSMTVYGTSFTIWCTTTLFSLFYLIFIYRKQTGKKEKCTPAQSLLQKQSICGSRPGVHLI